MAYPTTKVEISFVSGPYVASPTWVDVTSYVRNISIRRGRTDDLQNFEAGTANIILDNRDRRFDPLYTSGPYYGNLTPNKQIRISGTISGTTYTVFRGYISGWPMEITEAGFDQTVSLDCFDAMGLLSQETLPNNWADYYIQSLNPNRYYKMDEQFDPSATSGAKLKDSGSEAQDALIAFSPVLIGNGPSPAKGIPTTSVVASAKNSWNTTDPARSSTAWSWAGWVQIDDTSQAGFCYFIQWAEQSFTGTYYQLQYRTSTNPTNPNTLQFLLTPNVAFGTATGTIFSVTCYLALQSIQHIAISYTTGGTPTILINGIAQTVTSTSYTGGASVTPTVNIGGTNRSQSAFWRSALTSTQLQNIYQFANNSEAETTAARFTRIMGQSSFPAGLQSITASPSGTVSEISIDSPSLIAELQKIADSEGGELYANREGTVTLTDRYGFSTGRSITNQATLGTGGMGISTQVGISIDSNTVRNSFIIDYANGAAVTVTQSTSVTSYGQQTQNWITQLSSATDATNLGNVLSGFFQYPQPKFTPLEINREADLTTWATVLQLELMDRITITIPQKVGSAITSKQLLQSIEYQITPSQWTCRVQGSGTFAQVFIINTSLLAGTDYLA